MTQSRRYTVWAGTNSVRGSRGIYSLALDQEWNLHLTHTQQAYNTGAVAFDAGHQRLFAASEGMVFLGQASGGLTSYQVRPDGGLVEIGKTCTVGQRPCRIAVDSKGENVYVSNFFGGSLAMIPVGKDGAPGPVRKLISEPRPEHWMHAMHCVGILEDDKSVGALNISQSEFVVYDAHTGARKQSYSFGERVFVRSFAAKGNLIYVMIQNPGDIYVLEMTPTALKLKQKVRIMPAPPDFYGTSAIAVTPNGKLVVAAVRRTNTAAIFAVGEDGCLRQTDAVEFPGETPRDFAISPDGEILVTALQASDEICVHQIDYENQTLVFRSVFAGVPSPAAIAIRKEV